MLVEQYGHSGPERPEVGVIEQTSGLSIIKVGPGNLLVGGADKRRDGTAIGGMPDTETGDSPPSQPGNVRAALYANAGGELFWNRSIDDKGAVPGYEVSLNGEVLGVFDALSYYDPSLMAGVDYTFNVVAIDNAGQRSSVATATLRGLITPTGLNANVYSSTAAELFWQREAAILARNYEIRQDGDVVATTNGVSYFTDNLTPGTDYTFEVIAIDRQGIRSEAATIMLRTNEAVN